MFVAWLARSATPSARSACAWAICEASGIFCVDTAVLDPLTWFETAENPVAKFSHCAAVRRNIAGLPDGQAVGPRKLPTRYHAGGGGTTLRLGLSLASTGLVSSNLPFTPPVGAPPPMVETASALA